MSINYPDLEGNLNYPDLERPSSCSIIALCSEAHDHPMRLIDHETD